MSSRPPEQYGSTASLQPASTSDPEQDSGPPSAFNLGFLRNITDKRPARDGNAPRRRGPKPDSKPALTRRQELNRQAQRTHRERKELYVKALEDEVQRLKEVFSNMSQDKDRAAEDNRQLKQLLAHHGIPLSSVGIQDDFFGGPSTSTGGGGAPFSLASESQSISMAFGGSPPQRAGHGVDHEQSGTDFVLTYDQKHPS